MVNKLRLFDAQYNRKRPCDIDVMNGKNQKLKVFSASQVNVIGITDLVSITKGNNKLIV